MEYFSKQLFLDEFTPVSIYEKVKNLYKNEVTFLFESTINSSNDGNFSYTIIGARERVWYENSVCYFLNENGEKSIVNSNPLLFLKEYYKNFNKNNYKKISSELGIGLVDGFIGNVGYDIGKEFEPILKKSMNSLEDQLNIPDVDLIRPKIVLAYSHKTSKLTILTLLKNKKDDIEKIELEL